MIVADENKMYNNVAAIHLIWECIKLVYLFSILKCRLEEQPMTLASWNTGNLGNKANIIYTYSLLTP